MNRKLAEIALLKINTLRYFGPCYIGIHIQVTLMAATQI